MSKYQNNFSKTNSGFNCFPKQKKRKPLPSKCPTIIERCPTKKKIKQADVTHVDCNSLNLELEGNHLNVPIIDVMVALAEVELVANIEHHITLPTKAKEIKNTRKTVYLSQCKAVPSLKGPSFVSLFITGYIHKNIQYSDGSGYIRDYEEDVPFSCKQTVALTNPADPVFTSLKNTVHERIELAKNRHGADRCQHSQINYELFNQPIECKLLASFLNEVDLLNDCDEEGRFNKITEKMEVVLFLRLLQKQQVALEHKKKCTKAANPTVNSRAQKLNDILSLLQTQQVSIDHNKKCAKATKPTFRSRVQEIRDVIE